MSEKPQSSGASGALFAGVLDNMSSGVLTLDLGGRITTYNEAAARLLGVPRAAALGETFATVFFGEEGFDSFTEAVLEAMYQAEEVHRSVVEVTAGGAPRSIQLTTTSQQQEGPDGPTKAGIVAVFEDVTEVERLRLAEARMAEDLKDQHGKLQGAYLDLEEKTERLDLLARRLRIVQLGGGGLVVLIVLALALFSGAIGVGGSSADVATMDSTVAGTFTVQRHPIKAGISVVGALRPGANVNVVGPFDGLVRDMRFAYGGAVERDAVVVVMDTRELETKVRDARGAFIKAEEQVAELNSWKSGAEMSRATRQLALARQQTEDMRRKLVETKRLLDQGIVAEEEVRSLQQQLASQDLQLLSAQQDVDATAKRGDANKLTLAQLEQQNAKQRLGELEEQLSLAEVRAPVTGVALTPVTTEQGKPNLLERGVRVQQGQTMFSIGDLESMAVTAKIDEVDINKVKTGLAARITSDAFPGVTLPGTVTDVSSQAVSSAGGDRSLPTFDVTVVIQSIPADARTRVRVGMSANVAISIYDKPDAITVPVTAILGDGDARLVRVLKNGKQESRKVETGVTTPEGVEIVRGLEDGEAVLIDPGAES